MTDTRQRDNLRVGLAQLAPVWLDREHTLDKICRAVERATAESCQLVVFGEALLPGYPFWIERTDGAQFESTIQKELYAHYLDQAIVPEAGDLKPLQDLARSGHMAIYVGTVERAQNRGGHSLYCSMIYIDAMGELASIHRKLMPTYEERLTWAAGDGQGLVTHKLGAFTLGGLNCWENWMPLSRAALYALGEDLHVAIWPGNVRNTQDLTRFLAREGRSYVVSVSGLMHADDFPADTPHLSHILAGCTTDGLLADGGSCVAAPDGAWLIEPVVGKEELIVASLNHARVREERQNFDPAGHYARPDITHLTVNRKRQSMAEFED